jgi:aryl-alcohol dehydrogenase-like predicted oxidoreductase
METTALPRRTLGRTGVEVSVLGLGGEGILRSVGKWDQARAVIDAALESGLTYFDSARGYAQSEEYYGAVLKERRSRIFLTSKTRERSRGAALAELDQTLRNMQTDWIDLWQVHDVQSDQDIEALTAPGGALEAFVEARQSGRVRHIGLTGHFDAAILTRAMQVFAFDTLLLPVNPAETYHMSMLDGPLQEANRQGMGVIAMKVPCRGFLFTSRARTVEPFLRYALSQPVSTAIIGCATPEQVLENAASAQRFTAMSDAEQRELEAAVRPVWRDGQYYKRGML